MSLGDALADQNDHLNPSIYTAMTEAQQRAYDQAQLLIAFSQGKKIEWKTKSQVSWTEVTDNDISPCDYRIAPEPQEVWLWVKDFKDPVRVQPSHVDKLWRDEGYTKKLFREVC